MKTLRIKPAAGKVVIDPATRKPLSTDGDTVPETTYWLRRLADRDVVEADAEAPAALPKPRTKRAAQADTDTPRSDP